MSKRIIDEHVQSEQLALADSLNIILQARRAFWGIDKVVLNKLGCWVDRAKLDMLAHTSRTRNIKQYSSYTMINDPAFGSLKFGQYYNTFCKLTLIAPDCNVKTTNVAGLLERLKKATKYIKKEYGIRLNYKSAHFTQMEIAFTVAYTDKIPNRVADILMSLLPENTIRNRLSPIQYANNLDSDYTVVIKDYSRKETNRESIFYNKTDQLKKRKGKQLPDSYPINIYRFEHRLLKESRFITCFGTNSLFGDNPITDDLILSFVLKLVDMFRANYIKAFKTSVNLAQQIHKKTSGIGKGALAQAILTREINTGFVGVIDAESLLYLNNHGKNASRERFSLVNSFLSDTDPEYDCPLTRMDGWLVEDIINDMLDAACHGLGAGSDSDLSCNGIPPLLYYDRDRVKSYLKYLNSSKSHHRFNLN